MNENSDNWGAPYCPTTTETQHTMTVNQEFVV